MAKYNLDIQQGSTYLRNFTYLDESRNVVDLTDYTARMMIRKHATEAADPIYDSASDGGITVTALEGKITLELTDEITQAFPAPFDGVYDLEITSGSGVVTRFVEGQVVISPNVTR